MLGGRAPGRQGRAQDGRQGRGGTHRLLHGCHGYPFLDLGSGYTSTGFTDIC